jgi:hypothetical protein
MKKKITYGYRIKAQAHLVMHEILKPGIPKPGSYVNGQICRVTLTSYSIKDCLNDKYHKQYENDNLFQVAILNDPVEYLITCSLLEPIDEI